MQCRDKQSVCTDSVAWRRRRDEKDVAGWWYNVCVCSSSHFFPAFFFFCMQWSLLLLFFLTEPFCLFYRPQIINYHGYFCTIKELAQSMRKAGWMKTHAFELGIEAIMYNRHEGSKKIIMPVRFSVREIKTHSFSLFYFLALKFLLLYYLILHFSTDLASKARSTCEGAAW